ncbi:MAG: hypothetical protein GVY25_15510, partial [Bacteroidetes bacterium]|nr:hypothetical protein [Bacteroidota bacterium]
LVFAGRPALAQDAPNRFPVYQDGAWGYIDSTGAMAISPQFDEASPFSDGRARVTDGDQQKFIDATGEVVLEGDAAYVGSFHEGRAVIQPEPNGPFGYIDKRGAVVISPQFDKAHAFSEGRAAVATGEDPKRGEPMFGYIDRDGQFVVEPQFSGGGQYANGLAPVQTGGFVHGKWGYIDEQGDMVIEPQFAEALPFSDGLAVVAVETGFGESWGYIDVEGRRVVEPDLERAHRFASGAAPVKRERRRWTYIDAEGEPAFEKKFAYAEPFHGPLARAATEISDKMRNHVTLSSSVGDGDWIYIDRDGQKVWPAAASPVAAEAPKAVEEAEPAEEKTASDADDPFVTRFEALLPDELPGGFARTDVEKNLRGDKPNVKGTYEGEAGALEMRLGHVRTGWSEARARLDQGAAVQEAMTKTTYRDHAAYERTPKSDERQIFVVLDPGAMVVSVTAPSDGPSMQDLRGALGALDWDQIETLAQDAPETATAPAPPVNAPDGFATHTAEVGGAQLAFAHPEDWAVVDLSLMNSLLKSIVVMRSREVAQEQFGNGVDLSTNDEPRLVTPDNVVITLGVIDDGPTPKQFVQSIVQDPPLREADVTEPRSETTVNGRAALTATMRGTDVDGLAAVHQVVAFTADDSMVFASILRPPEDPSDARTAVQTLLDHLTVQTMKVNVQTK